MNVVLFLFVLVFVVEDEGSGFVRFGYCSGDKEEESQPKDLHNSINYNFVSVHLSGIIKRTKNK